MMKKPTTPPRTYNLPEPMVQAIVHVLNNLPAGQVRGLLNAIEAETARQDDEAAAGPAPASVQASAPPPPAQLEATRVPRAVSLDEIRAGALG